MLLFVAVGMSAQLKMRDLFASMPDSLMPVLSKNNRLDCIDFIEAGMQARVRNQMDGSSELTALDERFLSMQVSSASSVEMLLLPDSTLCMVRTYAGPAKESTVEFYGTQWNRLSTKAEFPEVKDFFVSCPDSVQSRMDGIILQLQDLPFMEAHLKSDDNSIVWSLWLGELAKEDEKLASEYLTSVSRPLKP